MSDEPIEGVLYDAVAALLADASLREEEEYAGHTGGGSFASLLQRLEAAKESASCQ